MGLQSKDCGLGFRVWGRGSENSDVGYRDWGLEFRFGGPGSVFRIWGLRIGDWDMGTGILGQGY